MTSRWFSPWTLLSTLICLLILVPLCLILAGSLQRGEEWAHIQEYLLADYLRNTGILLLSVAFVSLLFALPSAWLVSHCEFFGRRVLEWLLVLPLAIPTYVAAIVYSDVPERAFPLLKHIRLQYGVDAYIRAEEIVRYGSLAILMAGVLYPYLYLSLRASFSQQRMGLQEASRMLGQSAWQTLFRVVIPLSRPAIAAGLALISMEVINDYGAVNLFTVPTLTEGIFRTWQGLRDQESAVRLAMMGLVAVLFFISAERLLRGKAGFSESLFSSKRISRKALGLFGTLGALICCFLPLSIGLIYPLWKLTPWAWSTASEVLNEDFWAQLLRSSSLALGTSVLLSLLAFIFVYAARLFPAPWFRSLQKVSNLGYAMPGAVIAIGVMLTLGKLDAWLDKAVFSGTIFAIVFAYLVRFLAVAHHPLQASFTQIKPELDESSQLLGRNSLQTLFKIHLPLMRGSLIGAVMLVFVDILKELPLTMILRPAEFETLSTIAFGYAKEGYIQNAALPSLLIVGLGATALILLNFLLKGDSKPSS